MATTKIVIRKNYQKKDGSYPIALRITKDRKSKYIFSGEYIQGKDWDEKKGLAKKSYPSSARLNSLLLKKLTEAHDLALEAETSEKDLTASGIKKKIIGEAHNDFFSASDVFLSSLLQNQKFAQHKSHSSRLRIFQDYVGRKKLDFPDLDVKLLRDFEAHLLYERKVAPRTVVNYLILIRTIYNLARQEFNVDDKNYPFGKGKVQIKIPESEKIGLSRSEVQLLETATGLTPAQQQAVHVWLISFYFAGVRIGDVLKLKWSDFKGGRLYYRMGKNSKLVSLAVPDKAQFILDQYKSSKSKDGLIFSCLKNTDLKDKKQVVIRVSSVTRNLNRRLEIVAKVLGIEKKLSTHIARHSFGNISGDKIPIQMLQKLYRHSSITTTVNYQSNFMHKETDDALEKVINF
ncbi:MAG: site-specific integrase [Bacteroidota bacterium]